MVGVYAVADCDSRSSHRTATQLHRAVVMSMVLGSPVKDSKMFVSVDFTSWQAAQCWASCAGHVFMSCLCPSRSKHIAQSVGSYEACHLHCSSAGWVDVGTASCIRAAIRQFAPCLHSHDALHLSYSLVAGNWKL
jgi:hypothetical protein